MNVDEKSQYIERKHMESKARGPKPKDYTGVRSGRLVAIESTGEKQGRRGYIWIMQCDCGNIIEGLPNRFGHIKSCGCLKEQTVKDNWAKLCKYNQDYLSKTPGTDIRQLKITEPNINNKTGFRGVHMTQKGRYKEYPLVSNFLTG